MCLAGPADHTDKDKEIKEEVAQLQAASAANVLTDDRSAELLAELLTTSRAVTRFGGAR